MSRDEVEQMKIIRIRNIPIVIGEKMRLKEKFVLKYYLISILACVLRVLSPSCANQRVCTNEISAPNLTDGEETRTHARTRAGRHAFSFEYMHVHALVVDAPIGHEDVKCSLVNFGDTCARARETLSN